MATLGDLHDVIQVLFGWDGDHLHVFQAGKKQYSDPLMDLMDAYRSQLLEAFHGPGTRCLRRDGARSGWRVAAAAAGRPASTTWTGLRPLR
jgi:Plasmid pRiA4b ORF-3-like protein